MHYVLLTLIVVTLFTCSPFLRWAKPMASWKNKALCLSSATSRASWPNSSSNSNASKETIGRSWSLHWGRVLRGLVAGNRGIYQCTSVDWVIEESASEIEQVLRYCYWGWPRGAFGSCRCLHLESKWLQLHYAKGHSAQLTLFWRLHFSVAICHIGVSLYLGSSN